MKLNQILGEVDIGDFQLRLTADKRAQETKAHTAGFWLLDRRTARRLAGPFTSQERAREHQKNRPDKIPHDAVIRQFS